MLTRDTGNEQDTTSASDRSAPLPDPGPDTASGPDTVPSHRGRPVTTARPDADGAAAGPFEVDLAHLLRVIASGDQARLDDHLCDDGRWWAVLSALERTRLIIVANVGPHRRHWPWIVAELTPLGRRHLATDH